MRVRREFAWVGLLGITVTGALLAEGMVLTKVYLGVSPGAVSIIERSDIQPPVDEQPTIPPPVVEPSADQPPASRPSADGLPSGQPEIAISPGLTGPGTKVAISGSGFPAYSTVGIYLGTSVANADAPLRTGIVADASGGFTAAFVMPAVWPDGAPITQSQIVLKAVTADRQWHAWQVLAYVPGSQP